MRQRYSRDIKNEISFKKALFRFSVVFISVLVAGLVTNVYISQVDLTAKIPEEILETKTYRLNIEQPEIRFKKGLFPIIGIYSKRLEWKDRICPTRRVVAHDVFLVLDFFSLFKGKFVPGRVDIDFADLSTPEKCDSSINAPVPSAAASSELVPAVRDLGEKIKNGQQSKLPKEIFSFIEKIKGFEFFPLIRIEQFDFKLLKSYQEEVEVKGELFLKRSDGIKLNLILSHLFVKGYDLPLRKAHIDFLASSEQTSVEVSTHVREGKLRFKAELKNDDEQNAFATLRLEKLPLSAFSFLLFNKTQISYLWLNCNAELKAPWSRIKTQAINIKDCGLDGPYGTAKVNQSEINLTKMSQLEVEFDQFKVDQIIKSKRDAYFSGVFSHYGVFSTLFKFDHGRWSLEGFLKDSELIFSRNNLRDIQKINKLPFNVTGFKEEWKIIFDDIELDEGEMDGQLEVQFKEGVKRAQGRLSIHKLVMNPKIYKLMILAQPMPLSFYGKIELLDRKITDWSALVTAKNIKGDNYSFSGLKVEGRKGQDESAEFKVYAPSGSMSPKSKIIDWVQATTLTESWEKENYNFKEFSVRLFVDQQKNVEWKRGYARFANGWQLSSEGMLGAEQPNIDIWLQWDKPNNNYLKWEHKGKFLSEGWVPQTQWVREWLEKNPEFLKKNNSIRFAGLEP